MIKMKKPKVLDVFLTFLKIGAFTFGGGYAMMPIMQKEVVDKKKWATDDDIIKLLVISESTPGVLAVNSATFIGYKVAGFWGSTLATLGVVLPSFIIISIISLFLTQFQSIALVKYAFLGIRAGVAILILNAAIKLSKKIKKDIFSYIIIFSSFLVAYFTSFNILFIMMIGALLGVIYGYINAKQNIEEGDNNA
ncbi:MAG TPA: chromate transporter [Acholeplasmataceae bacterium]|nr:chromate transporter [Acholeplasmataceae bacterium]